ncbi:MAG: hypothetical protein AABP62_29075 [Planctomycetota bacterium]
MRACGVGEFFKGWRRKAGLVTLVMACVLGVGWMRSMVIRDAFRIPNQITIDSVEGQFWVGLPGDLLGESYHFRIIPYWWAVLPLTLLSAWLIVRKRPKAKGGG